MLACMKQVTVAELRNRLSHYLRLVQKGRPSSCSSMRLPWLKLRGLSIGGEGQGDLRRLVRNGLVTAARKRARRLG
jgi:hypothetical protein